MEYAFKISRFVEKKAIPHTPRKTSEKSAYIKSRLLNVVSWPKFEPCWPVVAPTKLKWQPNRNKGQDTPTPNPRSAGAHSKLAPPSPLGKRWVSNPEPIKRINERTNSGLAWSYIASISGLYLCSTAKCNLSVRCTLSEFNTRTCVRAVNSIHPCFRVVPVCNLHYHTVNLWMLSICNKKEKSRHKIISNCDNIEWYLFQAFVMIEVKNETTYSLTFYQLYCKQLFNQSKSLHKRKRLNSYFHRKKTNPRFGDCHRCFGYKTKTGAETIIC